MSVMFNKTTIGAAAMLALMVLASGASAVSLGLPEGRLYYGNTAGQQSGSRARAGRSHAPARPTETRQSFSYEPAEGAATVRGGCGCHHHAAAAPSESKNEVAKAPQTTRRSFSYEPSVEPAPRARSHRSSASKKDPWLIPKTDPRRYSR